MFLNIQEMEIKRVRFDESFEPGELDFADTGLRQATAIHAVGSGKVLENSGGEARIEGKFSGTMESDCDRCLATASYPLETSFDLFYRPSTDNPDGDEVKIDEGEAEIGFYDGLGMELADIIKEQILLALPIKRTCREDCKGICPVCGGNRNESGCDCHVKPADDRWNALKRLY